MNYQRFCNQWYDHAAQSQNMKFSQRKSGAKKSSDIYNFSTKFNFSSLE